LIKNIKWVESLELKEEDILTEFSTTTNIIESPNQNSELSIMLKDTDILKELLNRFSMNQVVELQWLELLSEIHIDTNKIQNIS